MTYQPDIIFYHYPCTDGVTAAAVAFRHYGDEAAIEYLPGLYSRPEDTQVLINKCRDKNVLMLDFTFKPEVLAAVKGSAKSIVIIDHHIHSQRVLADHTEQYTTGELIINNVEEVLQENKCVALFDMEECGASLAYKFFNPENSGTPLFIQYVRDVDIAKNEMPGTHFFKWWSRAQPFEVHLFAGYINASKSGMDQFLADGEGMSALADNKIRNLMKDVTYGNIAGVEFGYVFSDYLFCSDAANAIVESGYKMGVTVYFTKDSLGLSFRSKAPFDCSKIAAMFGGGGHAQAAGANIPLAQAGEFVQSLLSNNMIQLGKDWDYEGDDDADADAT